MIDIHNLKSPISGESGVKEIFKIPSEFIVKSYLRDFNIDTAHFFEGVDNIYLLQCEQTGYKFYYPLNLAGDGDFYTHFKKALGVNYYPPNKEEFSFAAGEIKSGQKVLDVGCGDGFFLDKIRDICDVSGIELNDRATALCQAKGLDVQNIDIEKYASENKDKFDAVCFFQVLEHINDVSSFLKHSCDLLKTGGKLIIAVPDNSPFIFGYKILDITNCPPHHMGLWNKDVFKKIEKYFPITLEKVFYSKRASIIHYMYYLSSYWIHNLLPLKISTNGLVKACFASLLSLITLPTILYKIFTKQINGHTIVCVFERH